MSANSFSWPPPSAAQHARVIEPAGILRRELLRLCYLLAAGGILLWFVSFYRIPQHHRLLSLAFFCGFYCCALLDWRKFVDGIILLTPLVAVLPAYLGYVNYSLTELGLLGGLGALALRGALHPRLIDFPSTEKTLLCCLALVSAVSTLGLLIGELGWREGLWLNVLGLGLARSIYLHQENPLQAIAATLCIAEAAVFFPLAALKAQTRPGTAGILRAFVAGACIVALITLAQAAAGWNSPIPRFRLLPRAAGSWFDSNSCASYMLLALCCGLASVHESNNARHWLTRLPLLLIFAALLVIGSRAALLGLLLALPVCAALHRFGSARRWIPLQRRQLHRIGALTAALLGLSLIFAWRIDPRNENALAWMIDHSEGEGLIGGRPNIWRRAVLLYAQNPLTGIGCGQFYAYSSQYYQPGERPNAFLNPVHENAHNQFLQFFVELGVLGGGLFLLLTLAAGLRAIGAALPADESASENGPGGTDAAFWIGAGWLGFNLTLLTGHPLVHKEMFLLYAAILALLHNRRGTGEPERQSTTTCARRPREWTLCLAAPLLYAAVLFLAGNRDESASRLARSSRGPFTIGFHPPESDRSGSYSWAGRSCRVYFHKTTPYLTLELAADQAGPEQPLTMTVSFADQLQRHRFTAPGWKILNYTLPDWPPERPLELRIDFDRFWRPRELERHKRDRRALTARFYRLEENLNRNTPLPVMRFPPYRVRTRDRFFSAQHPAELKALDQPLREIIRNYRPDPRQALNPYVNLAGFHSRKTADDKYLFSFVLQITQPPGDGARIQFHGYVAPEQLELLPEQRRPYGFINWDFIPNPPTGQWQAGEFVILEQQVSAPPIPFQLFLGMYRISTTEGQPVSYIPIASPLPLGRLDFAELE